MLAENREIRKIRNLLGNSGISEIWSLFPIFLGKSEKSRKVRNFLGISGVTYFMYLAPISHTAANTLYKLELVGNIISQEELRSMSCKWET